VWRHKVVPVTLRGRVKKLKCQFIRLKEENSEKGILWFLDWVPGEALRVIFGHNLAPIVLEQWFLTFFNLFIKKDYQIYPQYTQWCSFIKNTKLTNSCRLEWLIKYLHWLNLWFSKFTPLEDKIYPQVKNHCARESIKAPWNASFWVLLRRVIQCRSNVVALGRKALNTSD